ncbi:MAG: gfo/Idh/MocA family oxidoreductase, partial [Candidatus Hydrogenedentes bacterium]|nr:gfo/Idh/MocA family oxidoreductase [Candidatus Hydrogenedentota bacterium]
FPGYTLVWEHQMLGGIGPNGKPHGLCFSGSEGTLTLDGDGFEVVPEPKKMSFEAFSGKQTGDARPAHVRNFLDCVKSREQPVENLEVGHHVSSVAHLGNIALRSNSRIDWDAAKERVLDNRDADRLVGVDYRKPWKLPYARRG